MPDEVTRRREQQLEFARRRIAERGDYSDPERGGFGQRAGTSQSQVAADILRRAVGLGGHLVVAFVSPVGASTASCPRLRRSRPSELTTAGASARVAEMIQIKMLREGRLQKKPSARPAGQKPAKPTGQ